MPCIWATWQVLLVGGTFLNDPSTNTVESWNRMILPQRQTLHVAELLEALMDRALTNCQRVCNKATNKFAKFNRPPDFTPEQEDKMNLYSVRKEGARFRLTKCDGRRRFVDLEKHTCTCQSFQALGVPCIHALVLAKKHVLYKNLFPSYLCVDDVLKELQTSTNEAEELMSKPVPSGHPYPIRLPPRARRAGRPKKRRYRSFLELLFSK